MNLRRFILAPRKRTSYRLGFPLSTKLAARDRTTARIVNRVLAHIVSEGTTVIVATHDDETRRACDEHIDLAAYAFTEGQAADAAHGVPP